MKSRRAIRIERHVLLVEVERRCSLHHCNERIFVSLTKQEAFVYKGFKCTSCERWNDDNLTKLDVPDWWDEIIHNQEMIH